MKDYLNKLLLALFIFSFSNSYIQAQNNSLNFDGTNDYVDCGLLLPVSYTKEAWIYITDLSNFNNIISGDGSSLHAFWAPSAHLSAGHNVNGGWFLQVEDPATLSANTWYHVAVTYDAATKTMQLYKNGLAVGSPNTLVSPLAADGHTYIGNFQEGFNAFAGNINEVRIWSVARSAFDIYTNMNTPLATPQPNLVAYYRCNQGIASGDNTAILQLIDDSGNNKHADIKNFAMIGSNSNFIALSAIVSVELLSFKAAPLPSSITKSPSNLLTWQTANEVNNKAFQVERSPQPPKGAFETWESIGFLNAKGKAATYDFTDNTPLSTSYYRLRQIDNDGKETLSKVVSVQNVPFGGKGGLKVYPSVTSHFLTVETSAKGNYQIINLLGQHISQGVIIPQVDVSLLPIGTYILKVGDEQATFVKQ